MSVIVRCYVTIVFWGLRYEACKVTQNLSKYTNNHLVGVIAWEKIVVIFEIRVEKKEDNHWKRMGLKQILLLQIQSAVWNSMILDRSLSNRWTIYWGNIMCWCYNALVSIFNVFDHKLKPLHVSDGRTSKTLFITWININVVLKTLNVFVCSLD
jgi:hypothetical protein